VNTAFPRVAEAPQHSAAAAIERYPRRGCLGAEQFVDAFRVKPDDYLVADHHRRGKAAVERLNQFADGSEIAAHVALFEFNASRREVGPGRGAWRSARLAEEKNALQGVSHKRI
jgi:hypothetical protein